ncbi:hypothetical protein N7478_002746 [Penicillium angulare]|uniref:uncharacterized protein n=1 Tax=Penicillium angulare TaxID=116970 RepID=UPI0025400C40|nr:uncharacterized protein N7478_002746 [Penicillium angulare]KAJ5287060.1 hypothetical protein N7478_002746 [Penicillium angulare]
MIQDAAAIARRNRSYPGDFGMHQIAWLPDGEAYIHTLHPAIKSSRMSYTVIGCGEFYDAAEKPLMCPWLGKDKSTNKVVVGNPDAKTGISSRVDVAKFVVATLRHPEISENRILGFHSDHISHREMAHILENNIGKPVKLNMISMQEMQDILKNPPSAPQEGQHGNTFPGNFLMTVRYLQGHGMFWRPSGMLHNDLFPEVKTVCFNEYMKNLTSDRDK